MSGYSKCYIDSALKCQRHLANELKTCYISNILAYKPKQECYGEVLGTCFDKYLDICQNILNCIRQIIHDRHQQQQKELNMKLILLRGFHFQRSLPP